jgi:predicted phage gp36 major capsid-like protein
VHSPTEPTVSPFADPPLAQTNSYTAQSQPSDIGFGYIAQNDQHVEIPMTPGSPLKSAMKAPGTATRRFDNPLSPTFHEEQVLEKQEEETDKEQAKDIVSPTTSAAATSTNTPAESQDPSPGCQVLPPRRELQL